MYENRRVGNIKTSDSMELNIFFVILGARACSWRKWWALWSVAEYSMEQAQCVCLCVQSADRRCSHQSVRLLSVCRLTPPPSFIFCSFAV